MYNRVIKCPRDVTAVFVNHGAEEIHDDAFRDCTELTYVHTYVHASIDISETVKTIYSNIFTYVLLIHGFNIYQMLLFGKICYCGTVLNVLNFPYVYMFRCIGAPKTQKGLLLQLY